VVRGANLSSDVVGVINNTYQMFATNPRTLEMFLSNNNLPPETTAEQATRVVLLGADAIPPEGDVGERETTTEFISSAAGRLAESASETVDELFESAQTKADEVKSMFAGWEEQHFQKRIGSMKKADADKAVAQREEARSKQKAIDSLDMKVVLDLALSQADTEVEKPKVNKLALQGSGRKMLREWYSNLTEDDIAFMQGQASDKVFDFAEGK